MRATWWQTRSTLQLAFSMDGAKAEECAVHSVTEESMLQLTWEEGIAFNAKFHQPCSQLLHSGRSLAKARSTSASRRAARRAPTGHGHSSTS